MASRHVVLFALAQKVGAAKQAQDNRPTAQGGIRRVRRVVVLVITYVEGGDAWKIAAGAEAARPLVVLHDEDLGSARDGQQQHCRQEDGYDYAFLFHRVFSFLQFANDYFLCLHLVAAYQAQHVDACRRLG